MLNFENFDVLTFDCYGTLIDWEEGILSSLKPVLNN
ncbi:MAG: haloacid dehalogenase, partial [Candidatus Poribacteria bacterium]